MMTEKKLAPEIKVMIRVKVRIRGSRKRRDGNMGNLAPLASQTQKAMMKAAPSSKGTRTPQYLQPPCDAINCAQRTDGQKGIMVKTRTDTYLPRLRVGASSEATASEVSSPIPAPAPERAMPAVSACQPIFLVALRPRP